MATIEQKTGGKKSQDQTVNNGFNLDDAPRKKKMTAEEMEARIRAGKVDETLAAEDSGNHEEN